MFCLFQRIRMGRPLQFFTVASRGKNEKSAPARLGFPPSDNVNEMGQILGGGGVDESV